MTEQWQYQIRVYLTDGLAAVASSDRKDPALQPLIDVLDRHDAALVNQLRAFERYVADAEKEGLANYPLYKWTKAVIEDPAKRAKLLTTFTVHVSGSEVYPKSAADALETDLQGLLDGRPLTRMTKHDTNPANNPQAPAQYRQ